MYYPAPISRSKIRYLANEYLALLHHSRAYCTGWRFVICEQAWVPRRCWLLLPTSWNVCRTSILSHEPLAWVEMRNQGWSKLRDSILAHQRRHPRRIQASWAPYAMLACWRACRKAVQYARKTSKTSEKSNGSLVKQLHRQKTRPQVGD